MAEAARIYGSFEEFMERSRRAAKFALRSYNWDQWEPIIILVAGLGFTPVAAAFLLGAGLLWAFKGFRAEG